MSKHQYQWYVEPLGPEANRDIAELLQATDIETHDIECEDSRRHLVFSCTAEQKKIIEKNARSRGLNLHIWVRQGKGKIRRWQPDAIRKKSRQNRRARKDDKKGPLLF